MARTNVSTRSSYGLGICSIVLGLVGLAVYWWTPTGIILCLAGMVIGLVGCAAGRRAGWPVPAAGLILSTAALVWCWVVAAGGMEYIRLHALR